MSSVVAAVVWGDAAPEEEPLAPVLSCRGGPASGGPGRLGAVSGAQACGNQAVPQRIVFSFC